MLEAEALKQFLGRQVFWLTADIGFQAAFPQSGFCDALCSGLDCSETSPITAAAPQRIYTVFPFTASFQRNPADLSKLIAYN